MTVAKAHRREKTVRESPKVKQLFAPTPLATSRWNGQDALLRHDLERIEQLAPPIFVALKDAKLLIHVSHTELNAVYVGGGGGGGLHPVRESRRLHLLPSHFSGEQGLQRSLGALRKQSLVVPVRLAPILIARLWMASHPGVPFPALRRSAGART